MGCFGSQCTLIAFFKLLYRRQLQWDIGFFAEELLLTVVIELKLVLVHLDDFIEILLHSMVL